jgi:hypothetical protein
VLLPTLINHKDVVGHYIPKSKWGYLAKYNRIIGGLRLSQERSKSHECEYKKMDHFYGYCQPLETTSKQSFGYPKCNHTTSSSLNGTNITACYHADEYEGKVDFDHDEAFSFDKDTDKYEM